MDSLFLTIYQDFAGQVRWLDQMKWTRLNIMVTEQGRVIHGTLLAHLPLCILCVSVVTIKIKEHPVLFSLLRKLSMYRIATSMRAMHLISFPPPNPLLSLFFCLQLCLESELFYLTGYFWGNCKQEREEPFHTIGFVLFFLGIKQIFVYEISIRKFMMIIL